MVSFDQQMGIGVAGSMRATIFAVAKCNGQNAPYCLPNEFICAEIARFLRLPVPPSGIIHAPHASITQWFASLDFNLTGNALPPVDAAKCFTSLPDESTGLLLFDILIANCDRHRANLAVNFSSNPPQMAIFDHSHALFGSSQNHGRERLAELRDRLGISGGSATRGNRHCFLDVIASDDHIGKWLERIEALPDFYIEDVCNASEELGLNSEEVRNVIDFLKTRRNTLRKIVTENRGEFPAIQQWRLIL